MAKRILFQGDSITDAGRSRDHDMWGGAGYPTLIAAELGYLHPGTYEFFNRGIAGNRSIDVLARIETDIIDLKPDVLSLLVGVNDVGQDIKRAADASAGTYGIYLDLIISQVKKAIPDIRIILLEPFLLKGSETKKNWAALRKGVEKNAAIAKETAQKYNLEFVPLLQAFDDAAKRFKPSCWLVDGVHPTAAGSSLIAREWIKVFTKQ